MSTITELRGQLNERRTKLAKVFEEAGPDLNMDDVKSLGDLDSAGKAAAIKALNDEMSELGVKVDEFNELAGIKKAADEMGELEDHPGHGDNGTKGKKGADTPKSIGEQFVESAGYKAWGSGQGQVASVEFPALNLKTTFTSTASTLTGYDRPPGIVLVGTQRLTVADLLAKGQTTQNTIRYVQEDTFTNAATAVAEGATKPEAAFDTSEVDAPVKKIAVTAKVTDELFGDFPAMRDYINNRLRFMVAQTEETQLLTGSGSGANLTGILNVSGIQTQALGADVRIDAFYKAITKIRAVGFFEPDGIVVHPDDWTDIRLLRDANGNYIWGHPSEPGLERLFGLPVVVTTAETSGTGLVGAFQLGAQIFYREGIRVESTNSNEDDFKKNLIAIRAEQREALAVYRPKAFCTVTGI